MHCSQRSDKGRLTSEESEERKTKLLSTHYNQPNYRYSVCHTMMPLTTTTTPDTVIPVSHLSCVVPSTSRSSNRHVTSRIPLALVFRGFDLLLFLLVLHLIATTSSFPLLLYPTVSFLNDLNNNNNNSGTNNNSTHQSSKGNRPTAARSGLVGVTSSILSNIIVKEQEEKEGRMRRDYLHLHDHDTVNGNGKGSCSNRGQRINVLVGASQSRRAALSSFIATSLLLAHASSFPAALLVALAAPLSPPLHDDYYYGADDEVHSDSNSNTDLVARVDIEVEVPHLHAMPMLKVPAGGAVWEQREEEIQTPTRMSNSLWASVSSLSSSHACTPLISRLSPLPAHLALEDPHYNRHSHIIAHRTSLDDYTLSNEVNDARDGTYPSQSTQWKKRKLTVLEPRRHGMGSEEEDAPNAANVAAAARGVSSVRESEEEHKEDRPMLEEGKSEAILYLKEGDNEGSGGSEELLVLDDDGGPQGLASSEKQQQQQQQKYSSSHSLFDSFPFVVELSSRSQILEIMRTTSSSSSSSSSLQQGAGPSSSSSFLSLPSSSSSCLWLLLYYDSRCGHCHQFAPYFGRFASSFSSSLSSSSLQSVIGSSTADYMYSLAKTAVTIAEKKLLRQMAARKLNHNLLEVKKKEKKGEEDADGSKQQQPQPFLKVTPKTKSVRRIPSFLSTEALNAIAAESTRYLSNVGNGDYEAGSLRSERQKRNLAHEKTIRKFRRRLGVRAFPKQFYSVLSRNVLFGAINCAVHTSICEEEGVLDVPAVEALAFSRDLGLSAHGDADYYYDGGGNPEGGTNETEEEDGGEGGILPHTSGGGEFGSAARWIEQARVFSLTFPHLLSTVKRPEEVSKVERGGETKISTAHTPQVKEEEENREQKKQSRGNRQMPSTSETSQTADDIPITPRMGVMSYPLHSYVSYSVPVMPVMAPPKPNVNNNKEEEEAGSGRKEKNDRAQNEESQVSGNNVQTIKNKMGGGADEGRADTNLHAGNNEKDGRRQGSADEGTETRKGPRAIPKGAMLRIMLGERTVAEGHQGQVSSSSAEEGTSRGGSEGNNDASSISGKDEEDSGTESPFTFEMNAVMALQTLALRVRPLYIPFASTSGRGIPDDEKEKGSRVVGGGAAAEGGKQNVTNFAPRKRGARHRSLEGRQPASSSLSSPPCGLVCELANVAYWDNTTKNTTKINRIGSLRANHFRHFEELLSLSLSRYPKNICGSTKPPAASSSSPRNVGTVEAGFTKGSPCFCSNKYFGATPYPYVESELGLISLRSVEGVNVLDGVAPPEQLWTGRAHTFNLSSSFSSSSSAPISISAVATSTDLVRVCGTTAQQPHTPEESPTQEESLLCSQLPLIFRYILHESGKQKELARDRQHQQQNQNHRETQKKSKKPLTADPFSFFSTYALPPMTVAATAESNGNSYLGLWTNSACELDLELSADDGPRQVVTVVSTEGVNNSAAAVNKPVESKSVSESLLLFPLVLDSSTASHQSLTSHRLRHNRIASVLFASAASAVSRSSYSYCSVCEATRHQLAEEKRIRLAVERSALESLNKEIQRGFYLTAAAASLVKNTAGGDGDGSNGLDGNRYHGVDVERHQAQGDGGLSQQRTTVTTKRRGEKELANIMEQKMTSNKVLRVRPIIFTGLPFRSPFPTPFSSYSYSSKHPTAFGEHIPDSTAGNTINTNSPNSGNRDHTNSLYIFSKRSTKHSGGLRHDDVNDQPCYDALVSHLGLLRPPALPRPKTLASSLRRQQRKHLIDLEKRTRGGSPKGYPLPTIFSPTVNKQRQKHVTFPRGWGYARQDVANALFYTLWFDVPLVPKTEQSYTTLKNFLTIIGDVLPWTQIGPLLSDSALNFTSVSSWRRRLIGSIVRTGVVVLNGGQSAMDRLTAENEGVAGGEERGQEALPSLRDSLRWAVCSSGVAGGGGDGEEVAEEGTSRYQGGQGGGGGPSCGLWLLYHTLVNSALAPQGSRAYDKHYALNPTPPPSTHFIKPPPTDPAQEEATSEERAAANEPFGDTKRRAAQQDRGQDFTKHQHYRRDEANTYGSSNKRNGVYGEDRTMAEHALGYVSDYALLFSTRHTCPSCGVSFTYTSLSTKGGGGGGEDLLNKLFYGLSNVVGGGTIRGTTIQGPHEGGDKTSPEQEEEEERGDFFSHPSLRLWLVHSQHTRNEQIDSLVLSLRQLADWTAVHWEGAIVEVEEEARETGDGGKETRKGGTNGDEDEADNFHNREKAGLHVEKDHFGDGSNNTTQRREMLSSGVDSIRNKKGSKDGDSFSDIRSMTTPMIAPISFSSSSPLIKLKKFLLPLLHNGLQRGHSLLLDEHSSIAFPPRALCVGCRRFARIGNARHQKGVLSRGKAVEKKEDEEEPLHHVNSRRSDHTVIEDNMSSFSSSFFLLIHPSSPSSASSSMSQRQSLPKNLAQKTKATRLPLQEKLLLSRIVRPLYDGFARLVESRWRRLQKDRIEYLKRIQRERDIMLRLKRGGGDIRGGDGENEEVPKARGDGDGTSHVALEVRARTTRRIAELERQLKESSTNDCCYDAPSTGDVTSSLISQRRDARRAAASRLILNEFFSSVLGSHYSLRTDFSDYILLNNTEDYINDKGDGGEEGEASSTAEDEVTIKWNMRVLTHFLAKRYGGGGVDQLELGSARVVAPWEERSGVEDDEGEANDLPTMTAAGVGSAAVSEGLVSAAADDEGKKKRVLVTNNNDVSGREEERRPHDVSVVTNLDNNNNSNNKKDEAPRAGRRRRDYGHCSSGKAKAPLRELLDWHDASFFAEEENAPPPPPHLVDKVAVWRKNKGESGSHAGKSRDDHDGFEAAGVNGEMSPHHHGKEHADNNRNINNNNGNGLIDDDKKNEKPVAQKIEVPNSPHAEEEGDASTRIVQSNNDKKDPLEAPQAAVLDALLAAPLLPPPKSGVGDNHLLVGGGEKDGVITNNNNNNDNDTNETQSNENNKHHGRDGNEVRNNNGLVLAMSKLKHLVEEEEKKQQQQQQGQQQIMIYSSTVPESVVSAEKGKEDEKESKGKGEEAAATTPKAPIRVGLTFLNTILSAFVSFVCVCSGYIYGLNIRSPSFSLLSSLPTWAEPIYLQIIRSIQRASRRAATTPRQQQRQRQPQPNQPLQQQGQELGAEEGVEAGELGRGWRQQINVRQHASTVIVIDEDEMGSASVARTAGGRSAKRSLTSSSERR